MNKLLKLNSNVAICLYIIIDIICTGAGMGVPIFCILLGFPLGYYIAKRVFSSSKNYHLVYSKIFKISIFTSSFTFLLMAVIWGRTIVMLFNPLTDYENFGHPFILYDPKTSFIGWLVLMIFISPFLQLLTTIFSSFIVLIKSVNRN